MADALNRPETPAGPTPPTSASEPRPPATVHYSVSNGHSGPTAGGALRGPESHGEARAVPGACWAPPSPPPPAQTLTEPTAPEPATPPDRMSRDDDRRMRHAAYTAIRLLPPAIAELVSRDLMAWTEFGYALNSGGLAWRLVADVEDLARQKAQEREAAQAQRVADAARAAFRGFAGTASEVHR